MVYLYFLFCFGLGLGEMSIFSRSLFICFKFDFVCFVYSGREKWQIFHGHFFNMFCYNFVLFVSFFSHAKVWVKRLFSCVHFKNIFVINLLLLVSLILGSGEMTIFSRSLFHEFVLFHLLCSGDMSIVFTYLLYVLSRICLFVFFSNGAWEMAIFSRYLYLHILS